MILIVDDRQENLFSLKALLELHRFSVDTALSGEEALKKILKQDYVLIILDVQMPTMDGFEVAETILGYSKTKDIPIIFLTALSTEKRFIAKGYMAGGADYITKPFDADLLLLKVKTFYRIHEQTRQLTQVQQELRREIDFRTKAEADLQALNLLLEQKVEDRTKELKASNEQLAKKNEELQQFAYISSHDLKEPLRKIIVFCNMLRDKAVGDNKDTVVILDKVIKSAHRMANLISDVLAYTTLNKVVNFEPTDINEAVSGALSDLDIVIQEKAAIINVDNLPVIDASPVQMQQLFYNLIANALKFSKVGKPPNVKVIAERVATLDFEASNNANGAFYRIIVSDDGIGFEEAYREKIFTIFQRLHGRSEYEGTGIGLAIVKKIVDTHHGIITAIGKLNEGSTFIIVLPLKQHPLIINE